MPETFHTYHEDSGRTKGRYWLLLDELGVCAPFLTSCRALICARISSYFQRIDALQWTPYMDECLQVLEETKEHPTDILLVQQVKFQLLIEKVSHGPWQDVAMDSLDMKGLPALYLKALQTQLHDLKSNVPLELRENGKRSYMSRC